MKNDVHSLEEKIRTNFDSLFSISPEHEDAQQTMTAIAENLEKLLGMPSAQHIQTNARLYAYVALGEAYTGLSTIAIGKGTYGAAIKFGTTGVDWFNKGIILADSKSNKELFEHAQDVRQRKAGTLRQIGDSFKFLGDETNQNKYFGLSEETYKEYIQKTEGKKLVGEEVDEMLVIYLRLAEVQMELGKFDEAEMASMFVVNGSASWTPAYNAAANIIKTIRSLRKLK